MSKKIIIAILVIALLGDYFADPQSASLNELYIVNLMVVDYKDNQISVDFISSYKQSDSSISSFKSVSASGNTITECVNKAENKLGMKVFLGHLKTVFLNEKFLTKAENYENFIGFTKRNSRFNHFVSIFMIDDENGKLLSQINDDDKATNEFLNTVVLKYPPREMLVVEYVDITNDYDTFALPRLEFTDDRLTYQGIGVIKNEVLSNIYDEKDEALYKLITNRSEAVFFDTKYCSLTVVNSIAKLNRKEDLNFCYDVDIYCEIKELKDIELTVNKGDEEDLEKELEKYFDENLTSFTKKLQYNGDDILNMILYFYKHDYKEYLKFSGDADDLFSKSRIDINTNVHIIRNEMNK